MAVTNKWRELIILLVAVYWLVGNCSAKKECEHKTNELREDYKMYIDCIMKNETNQQFTLCKSCNKVYTSMTKMYNNVTVNCSSYMVDQHISDQIHVIYNSLKQLWQNDYCDDCFEGDKYDLITGMNNKFNMCYMNAVNTSFCHDCLGEYDTLNDYYRSIDAKNKGNVCYDLHYMVNEIRIKWSTCKHEGDLFLFILATSFVGCLPILFYGANILLTKRHERNHEVLYDRETSERIENQLSTPFQYSTTSTTTLVAPSEENNEIILSGHNDDDELTPIPPLIDIHHIDDQDTHNAHNAHNNDDGHISTSDDEPLS